MDPAARLSALLLELGFPEPHAETTARTAVALARDLVGPDPEAVFAEARDIVLNAASEAGPDPSSPAE